MKTVKALIKDKNGKDIPSSKALLWGNNASWLCTKCGELVGNRTGKIENEVIKCTTEKCEESYEMKQKANKSGNFYQGAVVSIRKII